MTGTCGFFLSSITQEEVFVRSVVFAVHPEVREREEGKGWKGPKERRIFGRARKKTRKKKTFVGFSVKGTKQFTCLRATVPIKLQQKSPMGKDILLYPLFFSFFKIKFKRKTEA